MLLMDYYAYNNKLSYVHPGEKFIFFAGTLTVCFALNTAITCLAITLLMSLAVVVLSGVPWRFYLKLMLIPGLFLIVGVITVAISIIPESGNFIWATRLGYYTIGVTNQSLDNAVDLLLRSLGAVSCLYFLSLTTPLTDIVLIMKRLRVPLLVVELITLIYRFIFILLDMAGKIYIAQSSRLGYKTAPTGFNSLSRLLLSMFIKSYRHSQAIYDSLASRCYNGDLHFFTEQRHWSWRNIGLIIVIDGALVVCSLNAGGLA
ncbi:cobalt/nickel transport system permease protein [Desulfotomaculum arcticum]|uniref:Cobalt/nickel transport system permease protein n=1 Tax=Desulfotruncus arcticus DSM 17038 TaxID=1121424 RepID=A0A1I2Q9B5_9FIRM|nr:cobalt ECF transporter T component CbiQ [Desulfotruncus arcticus]SFG24243.1 cobalt/nickel transport system permease protein [Desulfotomaculum arcticum] [Desulfotruncus arcticus DSM 17038]